MASPMKGDRRQRFREDAPSPATAKPAKKAPPKTKAKR